MGSCSATVSGNVFSRRQASVVPDLGSPVRTMFARFTLPDPGSLRAATSVRGFAPSASSALRRNYRDDRLHTAVFTEGRGPLW